jgi:hypothetical protein
MDCPRTYRVSSLGGSFIGDEAPITVINDRVSAIWIDPDSELNTVVVRAANFDNPMRAGDGNSYISGGFSNTAAGNFAAQPWSDLKAGIVVGVGAPLIADLGPMVRIYAGPYSALATPRVSVGWAVGGVPNAIPSKRGPLRFFASGSPAGLNPLRLVVPAYGRRKITIAVQNSDGANATTANVVLDLAASNTTNLVSGAAGAKVTAASATNIYDLADFYPTVPLVDYVDVRLSGPSTNAAVVVQVED